MTTRGLIALALVVGVPLGSSAQTPSLDKGAQHRRDAIGVMEGVLAASVRLGALQAARDMQSLPGVPLLSGQVRARGFVLDGYGVFFDVEIPDLNKSVSWSMRIVERDAAQMAQAVETLRTLYEGLPDPGARRQAQQALQALQRVGPVTPRAPSAPSASNASVTAASKSPSPAASGEPGVPDPDGHYTQAVISACLDAMLDYSKRLELQPDEWLSVALRSSTAPLLPVELVEVMTIVLRVKGADLAEFLAGRVTREEMRRKVDVREF